MFFTETQNNSGGRYVIDKENGVCECVIIEADSAKEATKRFEEIGDKVDGMYDSCSCCGARWYGDFEESDGTEKPMIFSTEVKDGYDCWLGGCFIHYKDGSFKHFVNYDTIQNRSSAK